jgi:hypothetical protein
MLSGLVGVYVRKHSVQQSRGAAFVMVVGEPTLRRGYKNRTDDLTWRLVVVELPCCVVDLALLPI